MKNQYWITDSASGDYALVTGAAVRDEYLRDGWTQADAEPTDGWVHIWHEDVSEPGRVPVEAFNALWSKRGWVAGPPPAGVHPIEEAAAETAESKPSKAAASGSEKE